MRRVLAEYDQHARIWGGEPEQMIDAAAAAYLALTLDGTDTLLMAADHALRRELSRRIRDDLIRLGIVQSGPAVRIADGATASPGDLIICTRNDHTVQAGEPGRTLANGDLLRVDAVTPAGLTASMSTSPCCGRSAPTWRTCSRCRRSWPTWCRVRVRRRSWPATTGLSRPPADPARRAHLSRAAMTRPRPPRLRQRHVYTAEMPAYQALSTDDFR
jgi:hypothetical protein